MYSYGPCTPPGHSHTCMSWSERCRSLASSWWYRRNCASAWASDITLHSKTEQVAHASLYHESKSENNICARLSGSREAWTKMDTDMLHMCICFGIQMYNISQRYIGVLLWYSTSVKHVWFLLVIWLPASDSRGNTQTSNIHHAPIRKYTFVFSFIASLDDIKVNKRWR